jgi:hypothetical protein
MSSDRYIRALKENGSLFAVLIVAYILLMIIGVTTDARPRKSQVVDIVFVFDVTGSMQDKIDGLLEISSRFAQKLSDTGIDYQVGMVSFGALGEPELIRETFPLGNDINAFKTYLSNQDAYGGAKGPEDQPSAIKYAMSNFTYREKAKKILILITDEEILGGAMTYFVDQTVSDDWAATIQNLKKDDFTVYSVTIPIAPYKDMASETGGKFYDVREGGDFTEIIMMIAEEINSILTR